MLEWWIFATVSVGIIKFGWTVWCQCCVIDVVLGQSRNSVMIVFGVNKLGFWTLEKFFVVLKYGINDL